MDGLSKDGMATYDTSPFKIGGKEIHVPALMLIDLQECRDDLTVVDQGASSWIDYAAAVMRIASHQVVSYRPDNRDLPIAERLPLIQAKYDELRKICTAGEAGELARSMTGLMRVSGFLIPEPEAEPTPEAIPGTGTSTLSPSDSPVEGFAGETITS